MPFADTWMDLEIIVLSEVRKRKTNTYSITDIRNFKKMIQINLLTKQTHKLRK